MNQSFGTRRNARGIYQRLLSDTHNLLAKYNTCIFNIGLADV